LAKVDRQQVDAAKRCQRYPPTFVGFVYPLPTRCRRSFWFCFRLLDFPLIVPAMDHSPQFLKVVESAKAQIQEIDLETAAKRLSENPAIVLLDVREDHEWIAGHACQAVHLGKGILERDLEKKFPNADTEIIMYCGGGFRSILTCEVAQRMGYRKVYSLKGGYKALAVKWKIEAGA
jgi:rhodanese-related sulfurtransferase